LLQGLLALIVDLHVDEVVSEKTAGQKLHGKIIDPLGFPAVIGALRGDPAIHQTVSYGMRRSLEVIVWRRERRIMAEGGGEVFDHILSQILCCIGSRDLLVRAGFVFHVSSFRSNRMVASRTSRNPCTWKSGPL
jgi:hypothetical protein